MSSRKNISPLLVGVSFLLTGSLLTGLVMSLPQVLNRAESLGQERTVAPLPNANDLSVAFRNVARAIQPTVVSIQTEATVRRRGRGRGSGLPPEFRPFFPDLFEDLPEERIPGAAGLGSGVVVRSDGYVLTNNHVVEGASKITVKLNDGREVDGKVVGADPKTDIAVVKIDGSNLIAATLGDSDQMQVGDWVVAIGSPFGLEQTVTAGIISAKHRSKGILERGSGYEDFLQTDAAINPGNSGGPLLNLRGEVIGINTAIESRSGNFAGVGFAVPSSMIKPVLESLLREGRVRRGLLGAEVKSVDKAEAKKLGINENVGVMIGGVFEGKAADKAGIQPGDIVLEADGRLTNDPSQFRNYVASTPPGTQMRLKILRNGSPQMINVTLDELTSDVVLENSGVVPALEVKVAPLNQALADQLRVPVERGGVVVMETMPNGLADQVGIQRGDIISRVDGQPIDSASSLQKAITASREARRGTQIMIYRGNVRYRIEID